MKDLFPKLREVSQKNEVKTIRMGKLRSLDLSIQDDQLLAQQRIFYNQVLQSGQNGCELYRKEG
jgi:hypothetical protein